MMLCGNYAGIQQAVKQLHVANFGLSDDTSSIENSVTDETSVSVVDEASLVPTAVTEEVLWDITTDLEHDESAAVFLLSGRTRVGSNLGVGASGSSVRQNLSTATAPYLLSFFCVKPIFRSF
jgi:hypothetical protein